MLRVGNGSAFGAGHQAGGEAMANLSYSGQVEKDADKALLEPAREALDISSSTLRLDECGLGICAPSVAGSPPGATARAICSPSTSAHGRAWTFAKRRLAFAEVTQDADGEGVLRFELPVTEAQASAVRALAGLHRQWSEEARAALSERSKASGFGRRGPLSMPAQFATNGARTSAEPVDGRLRLPSDARVSDAYVPDSSPLKATRQLSDEQLEAAREGSRISALHGWPPST